MDIEKSVGISFRVSPRTKKLLEAAAAHERRSLTNTLEVLVEDYCAKHSITVSQDVAHASPVVPNKKKT